MSPDPAADNVRVTVRRIHALCRPVTRFELPLPDVAAAVALLAGAELQIWLTSDLHASRAGLALTYALVAGAVAWRRRSPWGAIAVIVVMGVATVPLYATDGTDLIVGVVIATLVIAYSVAAYEPRTDVAAAGLVALVAVYWLGDLRQGNPPGEYLGSFVGVAGAWLAGRGVARERRHGRQLTAALAELKRQRARAERSVAETERTRIARELHDVVAHSLTVIAVQADAAEVAVERSPSNARRGLTVIRATAHEALEEMRRLLSTVREQPTSSPAPTVSDLRALRDRLAATGTEVELRLEGDQIDLPAAVDRSAFRIVQEGLTNAQRHARAARAEVTMRYTSDALEICIENDLPPDRRPPSSDGYGLIGVGERAEALGGTMTAGPLPNGVWRLQARLPIGRRP